MAILGLVVFIHSVRNMESIQYNFKQDYQATAKRMLYISRNRVVVFAALLIPDGAIKSAGHRDYWCNVRVPYVKEVWLCQGFCLLSFLGSR